MNKIMYLDAAASALKPDSVLRAQVDFLRNDYANSGRGICARAVAVDAMVESTRGCVANFIGARPDQIVFTSGTTDGLNRIVHILKSMPQFQNAPRVLVSDLDHHSARLPWMHQADINIRGAKIDTCPLDDNFNYDVFKIPAADIFVITAMSNVLGTSQDVAEIIRVARRKNPNVVTVVDAAQYVAHDKIDADAWNADFICFSGHKIGADTGLGIMYVKNPRYWGPDKFGGGMVARVTRGDIIYNDAPEKFEAGTLPLTQIAGLTSAIDYLESNPTDGNLTKYLYDELSRVSRIRIITKRDAALLTFAVDGMHPIDFGAMAGACGLCLRVGNMCATWIHSRLGLDAGSIRISVGPWNTMGEIEAAAKIIKDIVK